MRTLQAIPKHDRLLVPIELTLEKRTTQDKEPARIEDHGVIGNLATVAPVSTAGLIDRLANSESLSETARALNLPKSSISRVLARLEAVSKVPLFDRSSRHFRLSDAGQTLRPRAVRVVEEMERAQVTLDTYDESADCSKARELWRGTIALRERATAPSACIGIRHFGARWTGT